MNVQHLPKKYPHSDPEADRPPVKQPTYRGKGITDLPPELVVKILTNLNASDLLVCKRVNKGWRDMVMTMPAVTRAFYRSSHPPGFLPWSDDTVNSYYCSFRPWLESFSKQGSRAVTRLDKLLQSGQSDFPEQLFFATVNLLDETKRLHGSRKTLSHVAQVNDVLFSPDERYLVSAFHDGIMTICRLVDGQWQESQTLTHPDSVSTLRFSPDSRYFIATFFYNHTATIWGLTDAGWQESTNLLDLHPLCQPNFSADANCLVKLSGDSRAQIYQRIDGQWQRQSTTLDRYLLRSAKFHPLDSNLLITSYQEIITIWRCVDGCWQEDNRLVHKDPVLWRLCSPNGNRLLTIAKPPTKDCPSTAYIWKPVNGSWQQQDTPQLPCQVAHAYFNRDGNHLLLWLTRGTVDLWQCLDDSWQRVNLPHPRSPSTAYFSVDGSKLVISDSVEGTAIVWGYMEQQWRKETVIRDVSYLHKLCSSASGNHLLTGSAQKTNLDLWGIVKGQWQKKTTLPCPGQLHTIEFSPHGGHIVATDWYKGVYIWTIQGAQN